ncbi:MAG TPA: hypothetical protein VFO50_01300 [Candidatus Limnocylindrales bacterium]|nr:hypothetical protein [Candidatus Limnocylindrales bacterium]HEU4919315.1 hypothetical protein [Candidatus Limnocylindrales bacterium]
MHPTIYHELAKIKIADELAYADRQRLARLASGDTSHPIDFRALVGRARIRLFGRPSARPSGPLPAGA